MLRPYRHIGMTLAVTVLLAALNVAPAAAQGMYPGGYMSGSGGMPYRAPAVGGPSYGPPTAGNNLYGSAVRYTVRAGDTLSRIAARFGVNQLALLRANPAIMNANRIFAGQVLIIPTGSAGNFYSVVFGDTLTRIAMHFGTSVSALLQANPSIRNPNLIFAGQKLAIPAAGSSAQYGSQASGAQYGAGGSGAGYGAGMGGGGY